MRKKNIDLGILSPGGRTMISITKKASMEFLTSMYRIETGTENSTFDELAAFSEEFFSCRAPVPPEFFEGEYTLEAKATADLIKRPAPLSLLDPFITSEITETPWVGFGD